MKILFTLTLFLFLTCSTTKVYQSAKANDKLLSLQVVESFEANDFGPGSPAVYQKNPENVYQVLKILFKNEGSSPMKIHPTFGYVYSDQDTKSFAGIARHAKFCEFYTNAYKNLLVGLQQGFEEFQLASGAEECRLVYFEVKKNTVITNYGYPNIDPETKKGNTIIVNLK